MKKDKKQLIISVVAIVLIVVLVVTATYAYFATQTGDPASTDIKITTATVDSLTFSTGDAISLSATQSNFGTGSASLSDSTTATATLVPNNSTNSADATYYLYVKISSNDFVYTTDDSTAELILSITDPDGNAITSLSGLTFTTVTDNQGTSYSGFDVTTKTGLIAIAELYSIVADGNTKVDDWTITLTFVNLNTDQLANAGSSFEASVIIQAEELNSSLASYIISLYTSDGENNLYYFDGEGDYTNAELEAVDYSYRYAGTSDSTNNYVCFGSDSDTCETDNLYRIIGVFQNDSGDYEAKLIKYDYANSDLLGTDGDYYDSDAFITGLFELYYKGSHSTITGYYWNYVNLSASYSNSGYYNDWSYSQLNTVNLNTNYYNSLDSKWQDMITTHTWITGGNTYANIMYGPNGYSLNAYNAELVNYETNQVLATTYSDEIGLIYVSDYYYSANPTYWSYPGFTSNSNPDSNGNYGEDYDYRAATGSNWMYMGIWEWTISRNSSNAGSIFLVELSGEVYCEDYDVFNYFFAVRPVLYLVSSVSIVDGEGTIDSPYRLSGN